MSSKKTLQKSGGKKTKDPKKRPTSAKNEPQNTAQNGTSTVPDFLFTGKSPEEQEQEWLENINDLIQRKRKGKESDKFSDNLERLYDDLLEELSKRCRVQFKAIFRKTDDDYSDSGKEAYQTPRIDPREKELEDKLAESAAKMSEIKKDNDKLNEIVKKSKEELQKFETTNKNLQKLVDDKTKEVQNLKNEITKLTAMMKDNEMKQEVVSPKEKYDPTDLQERLENLEKNIKQRNEQIEELREEKSDLMKQVDDLQKGKTALERDNVRLTTEFKKLKAGHEKEKDNKKTLENENQELKKHQKSLSSELQEIKSKFLADENTGNAQVKRLTGENEKLKLNEKKVHEEINKLKERVKELENKNRVQTAELEERQHLIEQIQSQVRQEVDEHNKKSENLSKNLMNKEHEIVDLKRVELEMKRSHSSLQKQIDEQNLSIKRLEEEKIKLKRERKSAAKPQDQKLKELQDENKSLRDRLSQVAGSKLTDGNPAITDLGDPNRPSQLGEKFSELYDNEWTDAMEELSDSGDERICIETLRNIVEKSYEFGKTRAAEYVKGLEEALLKISNSIQVTQDMSKYIKDHQRNTALLVVDNLCQSFLSSHTEYNVGKEGVKKFIKKCVSLCWFMAIQDPPVVLTTKTSNKFDTDLFRYYTKSGTAVDYVVWPVVFLYEGGPIICKGVAQGK